MDREQIGFDALVNAIGRDFIKKHKDAAIFSCGETEKGLYCFIGIDLHPEIRQVTIRESTGEWDIYASCYVLENGEVVMDECRLPK